MRLNNDERDVLKTGAVVKCWRPWDPVASDVKKRYAADGEFYTVIDKKRLTLGDVHRKYGQKLWEEVKAEVATHTKVPVPKPDAPVWLVTIVTGDWTDKPRLLQPTGRKPGDYTEDPHRAMDGEPEAVSADVADRFAKRANERRVAGKKQRKQLKYAKHALNKLGSRP